MPYGLNDASMNVGILTDLPFRSERAVYLSEIEKRLGAKGIKTEVSVKAIPASERRMVFQQELYACL